MHANLACFSEKYKGQQMQLEKEQRALCSNIKHEFEGNERVLL